MSRSNSRSRSSSRERNARRHREKPARRDNDRSLKRRRKETVDRDQEQRGRPRDEDGGHRRDERRDRSRDGRSRDREDRRDRERRRSRAERHRKKDDQRHNQQDTPPVVAAAAATASSSPSQTTVSAAQNRGEQRFRVAPNFTATGGGLSGQTVTVFRFLHPDREGAYTHKMSSEGQYRNTHRNLASMDLISLMTGGVTAHAQGEDGTPFISVALNPYSVALSADDSEGGVQSIIRGAPKLEAFNVPVEYLLPSLENVSRSETELVVLLPPGESLLKYRQSSRDNPFAGRTKEEMDDLRTVLTVRATETVINEDWTVSERSI